MRTQSREDFTADGTDGTDKQINHRSGGRRNVTVAISAPKSAFFLVLQVVADQHVRSELLKRVVWSETISNP
jgi:hypothetical protein